MVHIVQQPRTPGPRGSPRGFTFVELLVVILLVSLFATIAGSVFTGPLSYYKLRRTADVLHCSVRGFHQQVRSRGPVTDGGGGAVLINVLKFYTGQRLSTGGIDPRGFSYLLDQRRATAPALPNVLADLAPADRARVMNIDLEARLVADGSVAPPVDVPTGTEYRFQLVVQRGAASTDWVNDYLVVPQGGAPTTIDLYNRDVGYWRLELGSRLSANPALNRIRPNIALKFETL